MSVLNKSRRENQIARIDTRDSFLEVLNNMFDKDKVIVSISSYDKTQETGSKITNEAKAYIPIDCFAVLCDDIKLGIFKRQLDVNKQQALTGKGMEVATFEHLGGSPASKVDNKYGQGVPEARIFKITSARLENSAMVSIVWGPGKLEDNLYVPNWNWKDKKTYKSLFLVCPMKEIKNMAKMYELRLSQFMNMTENEATIKNIIYLNRKGMNDEDIAKKIEIPITRVKTWTDVLNMSI